MTGNIDKTQLLSRLDKLSPEKKEQSIEDVMRRVSLATALPALTEINHENEYKLTREVASHLIGKIHEPEEPGE